MSTAYYPDPNFYKNQIKEQEKFRTKLEKASYDTGKRGYTIDGKFYTLEQQQTALNAIDPKIAAIEEEEKREGRYGPAYSKNAKPNEAGVEYLKLVTAAKEIEVTDFDSAIEHFKAWKAVEDFTAKNPEINIVQKVTAIVPEGKSGRRVSRFIPALIKVSPDTNKNFIKGAEDSANKYAAKDVTRRTRVQTYGEPGAANATFKYRIEPIDEPVFTARQEEISAIKNNQAIPTTVRDIARRQPSEEQVVGVTPAVTTPKGSAGKSIYETAAPARGGQSSMNEAETMAAYGARFPKKEDKPKPKGNGGGVGGGVGNVVTPKTKTNWEAKFREMFPGESWMLDLDRTKYADVFKLFQKSIDGKVYETAEGLARFKAQLEGTSFVKELASTNMVRQVKNVVGDLGFDSMPFNSFLTKAMNLGWKDETLKQEVYKEAFRKDDTGKFVNPTAITRAKASNDYLTIAKIGKSYFSTVADDTIQGVLTGGMAPEDVQRQQRELAKTKYGHLSNLLEQGFSMEQLASSFKDQTARLLEKDPNSIDMSQADYEQAFNFGEEGKKRMMSTGELEIKLRSDPRYNWGSTENAKDEARRLSANISQAFGKVI